MTSQLKGDVILKISGRRMTFGEIAIERRHNIENFGASCDSLVTSQLKGDLILKISGRHVIHFCPIINQQICLKRDNTVYYELKRVFSLHS